MSTETTTEPTIAEHVAGRIQELVDSGELDGISDVNDGSAGGKTELAVVAIDTVVGHITLTAAADAPAVERQLVPVTVHATINFVMKHTFASAPVRVSVTRP